MARELDKVIETMKAAIPAGQVDLLVDLDRLMRSACFAAPELHPGYWQSCGQVLHHYFKDHPDNLTGWQRRVADIFMDRLTPDAVVRSTEGQESGRTQAQANA